MTLLKNLPKLFVFSIILLIGCEQKTKFQALSDGPRRAEILFLGHDSKHHDSEKLLPYLARPLFQKGINFTYTSDPNDLNDENLSNYDGIAIYANHNEITPVQEAALKKYVESGKGFIPLHSASFCFRNSDWYVSAVGGQFKSHGTGEFFVDIIAPEHPIMNGVSTFETWDETYLHSNINPDMTVLMEREENGHREPWTWIRNQGEGRVFYTAYGHDERTWSKPEFHTLVANGILWAIGEDVAAQVASFEIPQPKFEEAVIPNYENRDPAPKFQHPLSPEESMKLIQIPIGFELQLFASEPDIVNPMAMCWDEKGRLYVIETEDYPNEVRKEGGNDRIKILEDTNGDGKADKITVFAEGLNIPTSLVAINGGILISMAPDFIFLKDTDGDGKADVREVVITGWGKSDTHAGPSNLKYGFDNKIWGVLGYSGFKGEVDGKPFTFSQGIYRFTPEGKEFEFLGSTSNNTWGLGFSEDFNVFISTANGQHSAYLAMSNNYVRRPVIGGMNNTVFGIDSHYDMPHHTPALRQVDYHGGYTAAAGHNFYTARNFPKNYWNRIAFVAEPTGRVLHNAIILEEGSGFKEKNGFNILSSSDEWFSPVHAEVGPDGALWVADWYNFIIQHNPTPRGFENGAGNAYINPMRDNKHGRIYRLVYKGGPEHKTMDLDPSKNKDLIAGLKSDNMFWRMTAQRLIVENQNIDIKSDLYKLIENRDVDELGLNTPAIHALWTLHGLGLLDGSDKTSIQIVSRALNHPSAGVRKNAVEVLPKTTETFQTIQGSKLHRDPNMNVRKSVFQTLADIPTSPEISKLLHEASLDESNAKDKYLPQVIFAGVMNHASYFEQNIGTLFPIDKPDSLYTLTDKLAKSLIEEQYNLDRRAAIIFPPDVSGKEIRIRTELAKGNDGIEGVIIAQGNKENGYTLFAKDNSLSWVVKQNGKTYKISTPRNLPDNLFTVQANLLENGEMNLLVDGNLIGKAKAPALFEKPLSPERIRVGNDMQNEDQVGDFEGGSWLRGRMGRDSYISLKDPNLNLEEFLSREMEVVQPAISRDNAIIIKVGVIPHEMKYNVASFKVKAGQPVIIDFENKDFMQHNLLIGKIGSLEKIGKAADEMARDPKGIEKNYIPEIPEIIVSSKLVDPDNMESIMFIAPSQPGEYPFICTVPGHWRIMNGIMIVE
ncbi:putative membrane-bound dehydrogenase domain-containing protein [Aquiflexum balticum DSM 16537]|uniref:Putative membrane-bound dehydrogenase domain-containing protein n=1 Tax=Aquiflexum balticum DSM 16537 TaxID=758820 RepID=A0A1W2H1Y0_9BACT|nr:PVC-type heme-binding CxxCH protein [Aquiflexum balticum]SMD42891.1 putative membrane-bound dehydrogenase domain-containing protein [Aquiflexum balticum DSM 16537]